MRFFTFILLLLLTTSTSTWALTFPVTNTNDAGAGSFRQAIIDANTNPGADIISIQVAGTLTTASVLPTISDAVTIDGTAAPGYVVGSPVFIVNTESNITFNNVNGLTIQGIEITETNWGYVNGFVMNNCTSVLLQDNVLRNKRQLLNISGGQDFQILGNQFINGGQCDGSCSGPTIIFNNITAGVIPGGIFFDGNNTFIGNKYGISITNMSGLIISNGTVPGSHIIIDDNSGFSNYTDVNLVLLNADNIIIDNVIINRLAGATTGSTTSILLQNNCDNVIIQNCTIGGQRNGINVLNGSDVQILNNTFDRTGLSGRYAIELSNVAAVSLPKSVVLSGNSFTASCQSGLSISNIPNQVISDGSVAGTNITIVPTDNIPFLYGIALRLDNTTNTIVENIRLAHRTSSFGTGLQIVNSTNVSANKLRICNRATAIDVNGGSGHAINNCNLDGNTVGLNATNITMNAFNNTISGNGTGIRNNSGAFTVDANNNDWGAANGSSTDGGSGDSYTGVVTNTTTFRTTADPTTPAMNEINLLGNAITIVDGDVTPDVTDDTDMGTAGICGGTVTKTYTIENTGGVDLNVSDISSTNALFTISGISFPTVIAAASSTTFSVTFTPTALGAQTATINILDDDCDEYNYNFNVTASGVAGGPGIADDIRDNALDFDGADDKISLTTMPALPSWTIEAWIYMEANGSWKTIYAPSTSFGVFMKNGQINFYSGGDQLIANTVTALNQWNHIAVTYDGTNLNAYLNGVPDGNSTYVGGGFPSGTGFIAGQTIEFFDGKMDEVRIWNSVRTENQIRENMHLTLSGCNTGLVAYYQMNEASGSTTLSDKTANGNTGTLTNMDVNAVWVASDVNVGNDAAETSNSVSVATVPAGASSQSFGAANLEIQFLEHSGVEDYTVTYQAFTPNTNNGATGTTIFDNPMWTVNKSTATETQKMNLTFNFPSAPLSSLDPTKYRLYWRPMNGEGDWSLLKGQAAAVLSASQIQFSSIYVTGQFMVVKGSEANVTDVRGNMYEINENSELIFVPGIDLSNSSFTIELWAKRITTTTEDHFFGQGEFGTRTGLHARYNPNGSISFAFYFDDLITTAGQPAATDGAWHHLAFVYNSTTRLREIFVDGVFIASNTAGGDFNGAAGMNIGSHIPPFGGGNNCFSGNIDEFRIWNDVRTQDEIRENMHLTLKGNETNLVAYYQFNTDGNVGDANSVIDAVGANHGTCANMNAADYIPSEVAVAGGVSQRMTISAAGTYNFDTPDVGITFSGNPNGEIVVSRLEVERPTGWASIGTDVDNEYFVVWNYGTNATPGVTSMQFDRISSIASPTLTDVALYKRGSRDFGGTWGTQIATASALTTGASGSATFSGSPLTSGFSQFVIVSTSGLNDLPIELLAFDAERNNSSSVALTWSTASELNNKGFFVERMLEGETEFTVVQWVDGFGTTSETTHYAINNDNSFTGNSYYRLRQVDFDETESLSEIRAVRGSVFNEFTNVSLYPVPVSNELSVRFGKLPKGVRSGEVRIIDLQGRVLFDASVAVQSNQVLLIEEVTQWPAGMYMLHIRLDNGSTMTEKFVKE